MRLFNIGKEKLREYTENLKEYVENNYELYKTLYLDLGVKTVRLLVYSEEFIPHIEKQMTFVLREKADKYDDTIVLWKENDVKHIYKRIAKEFDPKTNLKRRIELLASKRDDAEDFWVYDESYSKTNPIIQVAFFNNIVNLVDVENKTYYYGVTNLDPEEFIKEGHLFVQNINKILKTDNSNLVHGAAMGFNNNGILFCARGQRGKSTLTVLSMIRGFEYVSDDYLTLEKEGDKLYSYPIYSIITLSPRMYNELYDELKECRFVSNNARKDKYVFNIANFHSQFKTKYPISFCIFPEIVSDKEPSIKPCTLEEKGRAMVQLIHSTTMQMFDLQDSKTVKKIYDMVKDFEFLKFNLCNDIEENTRFLREYLKTYKPKKDIVELPELIEDITFNVANIINTKTFTVYAMNRFSTMIYQNFNRGVTKENLLSELLKIENMPECIDKWLENLLYNFTKEGIIKNYSPDETLAAELNIDLMREDNFYPWAAKYSNDIGIDLAQQGE